MGLAARGARIPIAKWPEFGTKEVVKVLQQKRSLN